MMKVAMSSKKERLLVFFRSKNTIGSEALVTLLREGVSVQEASVDSKRDFEDCLRSTCNDFIEQYANVAVLDQCKNTVGSGDGSSEALAKAPFMNGVVVYFLQSSIISRWVT